MSRRLPQLPFAILFEHEPNATMTSPPNNVHTSLMTRAGTITYQNVDTVRDFYGGHYGLNKPCQMCGRVFYDLPMIGLVVGIEEDGPKTRLLCDGVFHSAECAWDALQTTSVKRNPLYVMSESWLHFMFPNFKPENRPINQRTVYRPATMPNISLMPVRPAHVEGTNLLLGGN